MMSPQPLQSTTYEDPEIIVCRGRAQCQGAVIWPRPFCFCINVGDSWMVEEILTNLQRSYRDSLQ
jgi:hypothetical protein